MMNEPAAMNENIDDISGAQLASAEQGLTKGGAETVNSTVTCSTTTEPTTASAAFISDTFVPAILEAGEASYNTVADGTNRVEPPTVISDTFVPVTIDQAETITVSDGSVNSSEKPPPNDTTGAVYSVSDTFVPAVLERGEAHRDERTSSGNDDSEVPDAGTGAGVFLANLNFYHGEDDDSHYPVMPILKRAFSDSSLEKCSTVESWRRANEEDEDNYSLPRPPDPDDFIDSHQAPEQDWHASRG